VEPPYASASAAASGLPLEGGNGDATHSKVAWFEAKGRLHVVSRFWPLRVAAVGGGDGGQGALEAWEGQEGGREARGLGRWELCGGQLVQLEETGEWVGCVRRERPVRGAAGTAPPPVSLHAFFTVEDRPPFRSAIRQPVSRSVGWVHAYHREWGQ
jgi:hypothetical protein